MGLRRRLQDLYDRRAGHFVRRSDELVTGTYLLDRKMDGVVLTKDGKIKIRRINFLC